VNCQTYPELFSFAKNTNITIENPLSLSPIYQLFHFPLSSQARTQFGPFLARLFDLNLNAEPYLWTYILGSPTLTSSKAYKWLTGHALVDPAFKWLRKKILSHKHKVIFWLLLKDTLSIQGLLGRKCM